VDDGYLGPAKLIQEDNEMGIRCSYSVIADPLVYPARNRGPGRSP
jgi:hypothetical protein